MDMAPWSFGIGSINPTGVDKTANRIRRVSKAARLRRDPRLKFPSMRLWTSDMAANPRKNRMGLKRMWANGNDHVRAKSSTTARSRHAKGRRRACDPRTEFQVTHERVASPTARIPKATKGGL
jgi:hypothetical protein